MESKIEPILLTVKEAAAVLQTDQPTIRRLISKGLLRGLKLGRLKVRRAELERFCEWAEGKDLNDLDNIKELLVLVS